MVDHHVDRQPGQRAEAGREVRDVDQHLQMPAAVGEAWREMLGDLKVPACPEQQVAADPARPRAVQPVELGIGDVRAQHSNRAKCVRCGALGLGQRVHHRRVVGPVDTGLNQHGAVDAKGGQHAPVVRQKRVRRCIAAVFGVGVARRRPEHVRVGVDGAGRRGQLRRARVWVPGLTKRRLGHAAAYSAAACFAPVPSSGSYSPMSA